jgi:hypothetical protein
MSSYHVIAGLPTLVLSTPCSPEVRSNMSCRTALYSVVEYLFELVG